MSPDATTAAAAAAAAPPATAAPQEPRPVGAPWLYKGGRGICRVFTSMAFDLKVYGRPHVPLSGGVIIAANHQSYLDPVLVGSQLRRPLSFLAKSELFENRYFGWLIRNLNAFPVRQGEGDVGAVKETIRRLQEGHALTIFPEGSRSPDGELQPIQPGIALIVRRAGVPVVPCVIDGSFAAWPRHQKLPRPHPIRVKFGPAMQLADLKGGEIVKRLDAALHQMFAELRASNPVLHQKPSERER
jgi:1-acyl-sn-glycerol-3-phosphate acyltransferase